MAKTRFNLSIDSELAEFAKSFAKEHETTVSDLVAQYLLTLKHRTHASVTKTAVSDPAFSDALIDAMDKLRSGKANWHTLNDVFKP